MSNLYLCPRKWKINKQTNKQADNIFFQKCKKQLERTVDITDIIKTCIYHKALCGNCKCAYTKLEPLPFCTCQQKCGNVFFRIYFWMWRSQFSVGCCEIVGKLKVYLGHPQDRVLFNFNLVQDAGRTKKAPYQFFICNFYKRKN